EPFESEQSAALAEKVEILRACRAELGDSWPRREPIFLQGHVHLGAVESWRRPRAAESLDERSDRLARPDDLYASRQGGEAIPCLFSESPKPLHIVAQRQDRARVSREMEEGNHLAVAARGPVLVAGLAQGVAQHQRHDIDVHHRIAIEIREGLDQVARPKPLDGGGAGAKGRDHASAYSSVPRRISAATLK